MDAKLSHTAPYIAYAVATAGMAVLLLLGSSPGAIVARSYRRIMGALFPATQNIRTGMLICPSRCRYHL